MLGVMSFYIRRSLALLFCQFIWRAIIHTVKNSVNRILRVLEKFCATC